MNHINIGISKHIYLYPSTLFASKDKKEIHTVLGSCISICLFDPVNNIGGINHYMLPIWNGEGLASPKYGNIALEKLLEKMGNLGAQTNNLKAKIFGGAEILSNPGNRKFSVGFKNTILATEYLEKLRIPIIARSTGGNLGRKIIYDTSTNEIIQRFIKPNKINDEQLK